MDHYFPTILRNSIECILKLDNVRMFSTARVSPYRDLGERQPKLILKNRKPSKKILRMDERFPSQSMGKGRDLSTLSLLLTPLCSMAYYFDLRQCQISQNSRLEPFLYQVSGLAPTSFLTSVFTRTRSYRASLEDRTSKSNPQPLLSKYNKSRRGPCEPVCPMATPQWSNQSSMCDYLMRYI